MTDISQLLLPLALLAGIIIAAIYITRAVFSIPEMLQLQREQRDLLKQLVEGPGDKRLPGGQVQLPDTGNDELNAVLATKYAELNKKYKAGGMTDLQYFTERDKLLNARN